MYLLTPFLWALFPSLFLYTNNIYITPLEVLKAPVLLSLAGTAILLIIFFFLLKDLHKASLFISCFLIIFFSFEAVSNFFYRVIGLHELITSLLLIALLIYFVYRLKKSNSRSISLSLFFCFITGVLLVSFQLATIAWHTTAAAPNLKEDTGQEIYLDPGEEMPDIFYIVVDGYGSREILKDIYMFDNEPFLNKLQQKGFYIADESWSNYSQTILSLASNLNLNYLEKIAYLPDESNDRRHLINAIKENKIFGLLENKGYHTTSYFTVYSPVNIKQADSFNKDYFHNLDEFSHYLLNHSWLSIITKEMQYDLYRNSIHYTLQKFPKYINKEKPNFVYAHILPPHPPFAIDSKGEPREVEYKFSLKDGSHFPGTQKDYLEGYIKQVQFLNTQILNMVEEIKKQSEKPVIIIQADHGPGANLDWDDMDDTNIKERMSILNAFYFYDENYERLHESITPVNTFRIIFNKYFKADMELLDDKSFFSTWEHPYRFTPLNND